jgi:hypothetical protein
MWGCRECESTKSHAVKVFCLYKKQISLHTNHSSKLIFCPLTHCLQVAHMHVLGVNEAQRVGTCRLVPG